MELDEILHAAITTDNALMQLTAGRVYSTCVPVPPDEQDNTQLPYLIITDDPYQNDTGTKDSVWESAVDHVQASVIINAASPAQVKRLRRLARQAIAAYVANMQSGAPYLTAASNEGIAWDWQKPCYFDTIHYQCDILVNLNTEPQ